MGLDDATELPFPVAIENDPVQMAAIGPRLPAIGVAGIEPDVCRGADRIVGVNHGRDGLVSITGRINGGDNPVTSAICEGLVLELGFVRSALALHPVVEPFLGNSPQLAEQVIWWRFARLPILVHHQMTGQFVHNLRWADLTGVHEVQIDFLADNAGIARLGRPNLLGREDHAMVFGEFSGQPFAGRRGQKTPRHQRR